MQPKALKRSKKKKPKAVIRRGFQQVGYAWYRRGARGTFTTGFITAQGIKWLEYLLKHSKKGRVNILCLPNPKPKTTPGSPPLVFFLPFRKRETMEVLGE